jgi:hypothetical protein
MASEKARNEVVMLCIVGKIYVYKKKGQQQTHELGQEERRTSQ